MNNAFTNQQLHEARRQDWMREAEGGWQLEAAGVDRPGLPLGKLAVALLGALLIASLIAQGFVG